jgi:methionyl-tRNA formyltransferase
MEEGCLSIPGIRVDVERNPARAGRRRRRRVRRRRDDRGVGPRGARAGARDRPPRRRADARTARARRSVARRSAPGASASARREDRLHRQLGVLAERAGVARLAANWRPALVVTRPAAARARAARRPDTGRRTRGSSGSAVLEPERLDGRRRRRSRRLAPEVLVLCAYGALVREPLLSSYEILNVHPSLLPRWRGAAPIERAIMAGDAADRRVDHAAGGRARRRPGLRVRGGPRSSPTTTYGTLAARLADLAGEGSARRARGPRELRRAGATAMSPTPRRSTPPIGSRPGAPAGRARACRVRALHPHIGARLPDGLGVLSAAPRGHDGGPGGWWPRRAAAVRCDARQRSSCCACTPPGGREMDAAAYARGHASEARAAPTSVLRRTFEQGAFTDRAFHATAAGLDGRERALAMRLAYGAVQRRAHARSPDRAVAGRPVAKIDAPLLAALRLGCLRAVLRRQRRARGRQRRRRAGEGPRTARAGQRGAAPHRA